ncbi:UDP-N-acetylmuramoyl-L-alanyl-D-glutamate--2,6-diaminopimelate ligase [Iodidimonas nitroreducens]|uniref:UDP-N-acetylmuramoyl-L-alanyl-D-glutamate--2,6-diaminopimelate ligase n=1 Tax=Iodidimonas nitroreducens TaxID=1236968 RepID=A0A5A7N9C0_9PROT|nr:UDP-N-acetylmuramoyl-L-alanyl-D-glutamate--2,6-diaminopimelate ligase [Iodidimonas nitroreducens]GAK34491.1 UDP-N-acetylmuramoyl-L-alanyl-D-glutamate--2, 6-diaminopimelate ligase [alpha proteobacterium Q-1]GER04020.1 UDP-N-acetylmuramoyl-L-alanyl-D-glutamate--2,6-diaminopimelate ligase [Iodidimonas nitroreducens]
MSGGASIRRPLAALLGVRGDAGQVITGLTADSRKVRPGDLFAALPGSRADGRQFIDDAIARGAVAILAPADDQASDHQAGAAVSFLFSSRPQRRFAEMAAAFYGAQPQNIVCITGTNGKSSVASFCRQLWCTLDLRGASIGTLGVESESLSRPGGLTSPDPVTFHETLHDLAAHGITHVACEASSHGLVQYRLDGLQPKVAAFTNLSRDHLDYHQNMEAYFHAKARLFSEVLVADGVAVIWADSPAGQRMIDLAKGRDLAVITVGRGADCDLHVRAIDPTAEGQRLSIRYHDQDHQIDLPLFGGFQAENALLAAAILCALSASPAAVFKAMEGLKPVLGRLQWAGDKAGGGRVFVDYAHTPGGLETVLEALRPHCSGALSVVFGAGGDRDRGKRPAMGAVAHRYADRVIITDDNPRTEDPAAIRKAIMESCPDALEIADRARAIFNAINKLRPGDILVIAGKGHENGQIIGDHILPFSDLEQVQKALSQRTGP